MLSKRKTSPYVVLYECTHSVLCTPFNTGYCLSQGLVRFEDLRELDLSENDILYLPPFIGQLTHLTVLNMSRNSKRTNPPACLNLLLADWETLLALKSLIGQWINTYSNIAIYPTGVTNFAITA